MSRRLAIPSPEQMEKLGSALAEAMQPLGERCVTIGVQGELGAGKTTLIRAVLRGLGVTETVPSPTYTLVEPYEVRGYDVYHLDLYRLQSPQELDFLGVEDFLSTASLVLVEWPERAPALLQAIDLTIEIEYAPAGRDVTLTPGNEVGVALLERMIAAY